MLVPILAELWHKWVVIHDVCALLLEQSDDVESGTLSHVVNVLLVRDAEYEHAASIDGLLFLVERLSNLSHDDRWHLAVDLARQVDESRLVLERSHLPREIVRIERNAVSADARSRRELHEPERLRRRGIDHFPNVDAQLVAHDRHFVHQSDVDGPERVLEQLH